MLFSKRQLLTIFGLCLCLMIAIFLLFSEIQRSNQDTIRDESASDTVPASEIKTFLNLLQDDANASEFDFSSLDIEEKLSILTGREYDVRDTIPVDSKNFVYEDQGNGLELYGEDILDIARFVPNSEGIFDQYKINTLQDESSLFLYDGDFSLAPEIADYPLLRKKGENTATSILYQEKDGVFVLLGYDITGVFDFTINGKIYWVSLIANNDGFDQVYVSRPYFQNIEKLNGVIFQNARYSQGENILTIFEINQDNLVKNYSIDIEGVVTSPVQQNYQSFVLTDD